MTRLHEWTQSRAVTRPASSAHAGARRSYIQRRQDRSRANRQTLHNGTKLGILPGFFRYPIHVMQLFQWGMGAVRPGVATLGRVRGRGPPRQRWEGWSRNLFRRNLAVLPPSPHPHRTPSRVRPDFCLSLKKVDSLQPK